MIGLGEKNDFRLEMCAISAVLQQRVEAESVTSVREMDK